MAETTRTLEGKLGLSRAQTFHLIEQIGIHFFPIAGSKDTNSSFPQ